MVKISEYDIKLKQLVKRRNLSKKRISHYDLVFTEIFKLYNKLPSELLDEFKEEQKPFINKENKLDILGIDERKINTYQFQYDDYLKEKYNSDRTRESKHHIFRAFFSEYGIELPRPLKYDIVIERTRTRDLPTWENIKDGLKYCNSMEKALVSFIGTTGIRSSDVARFTIQDLLEATSLFCNGSIDELLSKNPFDVVPLWDFMPLKTRKRGNMCIVGNSGECSYYIFEYLKEREKLGYSLNLKSPLFHTLKSPNFFANNTIPKIFNRLNNDLNMGMDKNGLYGKFRAHNLRKLFSTTCRRNINKISIKNDNTIDVDLISIFMGHQPPNMKNSAVYVAIDDVDSHDNYLRLAYESLIPFLTINDGLFENNLKNKISSDELVKI